MTSQYRHRRSSNPSTPFPANIEPGEIAVNTANRQIALGDAASATLGVPKPLLAIRIFDIAAIYAIGDIVMQAGVMYRAVVANGPGAFTAANWGLAAAQIVVSDTPPPNPSNGSLWWESDSGLLYLFYVDPSGPPGQWVIASPQPDFSIYAPTTYVDAQNALKVAKTGDTMTGDLKISKSTPILTLDDTGGVVSDLRFYRNGGRRWFLRMAGDTETGGNLGSSLQVVGYADDGVTVIAGTPALMISRSDSRIDVAGDPIRPLNIATKQYVDAGDVAGLAASGIQVNGGFEISQEIGSTGTTGAPGSAYICDGNWSLQKSGTMAMLAASTGSVFSVPSGAYPSYLNVNVSTAQGSLAATDYAFISNPIEGFRIARLGWGTVAAQPITISFWSKHHRAGIYSVGIKNVGGARSYVATYTHNVADTAQYNIVTIPGDTSGTWITNNGVGLYVSFAMAIGSTYATASPNTWLSGNFLAATSQVNAVAATSDVFQITGVTILPGAHTITAAQSLLLMRPYDQELLTCQRYFFKRVSAALFGYAATGAGIGQWFAHPVFMRAAPTLTPSNYSAAGNAIGPGALDTVSQSGYRHYLNATATGGVSLVFDIIGDARI